LRATSTELYATESSHLPGRIGSKCLINAGDDDMLKQPSISLLLPPNLTDGLLDADEGKTHRCNISKSQDTTVAFLVAIRSRFDVVWGRNQLVPGVSNEF